jgi:hypothetical protein
MPRGGRRTYTEAGCWDVGELRVPLSFVLDFVRSECTLAVES